MTPNANDVFWLEVVGQRPDGALVITNVPSSGRGEVDSVQAPIEGDLVYPLIRGRDVSRWRCELKLYFLFAQDESQPAKAIPEDVLAAQLPRP